MAKTTITFSDLENLFLNNGVLTIRSYQSSDFANLNKQFDVRHFEWYFTEYNTCDEFVNEKLLAYKKQEALLYVIIENKTQDIVGVSCFYEISLQHRRLEMGATWFGRAYQGKFYNSMSKLLFLEYLFDSLGFNRIQWKTDGLNLTSQAAMRKLGFVEEGVLRKHAITPSGRVRDSVVFSVILDEWAVTREIIEQRVKNKVAMLVK